jgi:hypothetical protein
MSEIVEILSDYLEAILLKVGPRGFRQKNLQNWDSMNRRRRMKIMVAYFIYTVLVIDHCAWEMVKISPACRALTISL